MTNPLKIVPMPRRGEGSRAHTMAVEVQSGASMYRTAKKWGVSLPAVYYACCRYGVTKRYNADGAKKRRIIAAIDAVPVGEKVCAKRMAHACGCSEGYVTHTLRMIGR